MSHAVTRFAAVSAADLLTAGFVCRGDSGGEWNRVVAGVWRAYFACSSYSSRNDGEPGPCDGSGCLAGASPVKRLGFTGAMDTVQGGDGCVGCAFSSLQLQCGGLCRNAETVGVGGGSGGPSEGGGSSGIGGASCGGSAFGAASLEQDSGSVDERPGFCTVPSPVVGGEKGEGDRNVNDQVQKDGGLREVKSGVGPNGGVSYGRGRNYLKNQEARGRREKKKTNSWGWPVGHYSQRAV